MKTKTVKTIATFLMLLNCIDILGSCVKWDLYWFKKCLDTIDSRGITLTILVGAFITARILVANGVIFNDKKIN